jgi:chromosome segregation ATPase
MAEDSAGSQAVKSPSNNGGNFELFYDHRLIKEIEDESRTAESPGERLGDIGTQTNLLLNLIDELRSITDRACHAAVREAECADRIEASKESELASLQIQLKEREESLKARDTALTQLERVSKTRIEELENRLHEKETQLANRESDLNRLQSESECLMDRLNQVEVTLKQARSNGSAEHMEAELAKVRSQLEEKEAYIAARDPILEKLEADLREQIGDLQHRLQATESRLQSCEAELKEKETLIQAAAGKEAEIGKLIVRLSSECDKLSSELCQKSGLIAQLEKKERRFSSNGTGWKKVRGLF